MDVATLVGIVLGMSLIIGSIMMASSLTIFIHVPSLMITFGGTIAATLINYPLVKVLSVFKVAKNVVLFRLPPIDGEIDRMVDYANIARREGLLSLEEKLEELEEPFLNKGIRINVPEQRVNDAYRAWLAYTFLNVDKIGEVYEPHDGSGFYEAIYGIMAAKYFFICQLKLSKKLILNSLRSCAVSRPTKWVSESDRPLIAITLS